jgi:hypothetical protein
VSEMGSVATGQLVLRLPVVATPREMPLTIVRWQWFCFSHFCRNPFFFFSHKRLEQRGDQTDAQGEDHRDEFDSESNEDSSPARESPELREERSLGHFQPLSVHVKPACQPPEFFRHPMQKEEGGRKRKSSLTLIPVDMGSEHGRCETRDPLPPPPSEHRNRALHSFADLDSTSGR